MSSTRLGVPRLRLSSIEPPDVNERLLDALGESHSACAHLHVPLQSGSDRVLEAMGRRYDLAGYAGRIEAARDSMPGLAVTTDVIAGFPGEREQDAEATRLACERIGFSRLHVFRYSERASTPAATLPDAVPGPERARRAAALRAVDETLRAGYAASRAGETPWSSSSGSTRTETVGRPSPWARQATTSRFGYPPKASGWGIW